MLYKLYFLLTLCFLSASAYSQSMDNENNQLFDFDWKFYSGDFLGYNEAEISSQNWINVDLPHDWSIAGKIEQSNPMGGAGGYFPAGIGWYKKTFNANSSWKNKQVFLYFEGVYMNSEVFINGTSLGVHPYGFTPFYYNIAPWLRIDSLNTVLVKVDNSKQVNCRWYSGSGIYRHVWLQVKNKVHFQTWGVSVTTAEIQKGKATVVVKSIVLNETTKSQKVNLSAQVFDPAGGFNITRQISVKLKPNSSQEINQQIVVDNPVLWSNSIPHLYKLQLLLSGSEETTDNYTADFGIRSLKYDVEQGFLLNGETVKLNGGCMHHDNGCLGAAAFDKAEYRKVELLKKAGFNAVRTSHNPPSEAFLNACDKLGMLVIDEAFDGWRTSKTPHDYSVIFDQWAKKDLTTMIMRDRNHPSVIMWSVGNEIIERKSKEAVETAKMLINTAHELDSTRPVTSAMTTWDKDWEIFDPLMAVHDICGYNYQMHHAEKDHERVPSRIIVQTESYPRDAFSNWDAVQNHNYIIGDFVWTAMDYLGESGIGRYYYPNEPTGEHWEKDFFPWHGAYCGDIDLTGWRKPISHYRNLLWNTTEKLYMAVKEPNPESGKIRETLWSVWPTWESWTWPGSDGKSMEVEVYSKYPSVKLYLNNECMGEKSTTRNEAYKTTFEVPYKPGILKAVGFADNLEREQILLQTANEAAIIKLYSNQKQLKANGQDLIYITVEITDENGIVQPYFNDTLNFQITGPAIIAGLDNANLKNTEPYIGNTRTAWKGKALAILRSTRETGEVVLRVNSTNLKSAELKIISTK